MFNAAVKPGGTASCPRRLEKAILASRGCDRTHSRKMMALTWLRMSEGISASSV